MISEHVLSWENLETVVVCCCSGICSPSALHWRGLLTVQKMKKRLKKEKQSYVEPPHPPDTYCFLLCSFAKSLAPYLTCCVVPEKPRACIQHWSSPQTKPIAALTCILIISVSPPGWEINTSHQPSAGKHLIEAVNKCHAARDIWQKLVWST